MLRPRIIPCLLVHQGGLVKTVSFKDPKYVGDPINAVKIFNEKEADELMVIDIDATVDDKEPNYKRIKNLATECRMPLCYGGGVKTPEQAKKIIELGVEKVAISSAAVDKPEIISSISKQVGRQSVVVVVDVKKKSGLFSKGYEVCTHNATRSHQLDPIDFAMEVQEKGAGEIVLNFVDNDGQMKGYNFDFAFKVREQISVPLTILGGAGSLDDIENLIQKCGIVGASAGSLFVFKGPYKAVLINYPSPDKKEAICISGLSKSAI